MSFLGKVHNMHPFVSPHRGTNVLDTVSIFADRKKKLTHCCLIALASEDGQAVAHFNQL